MASDLHASTVIQVIAFLKKERGAQGFSQEALAKKAGLSRTGVRHIESAQFKPTLYSLLKIAGALRVNLPRVIRKIQIAQEERNRRRK